MSDPNPPVDPAPGTQPPPGATPPPGGYQQPGPGQAPPPGGYQQPGAYQQPGGYQQPGQPGYGQAPPPGYQQAPVSVQDEKTWAMLGHLGGILIGFVAGLIVYLVYKDRSAYLRDQGREALNFQITIAIIVVGLFLASTVLTVVTFGFGSFLFGLSWVPWVLQVVFGIIAGLAANRHEDYRYPFAIRLVK